MAIFWDTHNFKNLSATSAEVVIPSVNVLQDKGSRIGEIKYSILHWLEDRDLEEFRDYHYSRDLDFPYNNGTTCFAFVRKIDAMEFKLAFG